MSKKDETLSEQIHVKVSEQMHKELHEYARGCGLPLSTIVRLLLIRLLDGDISYHICLEKTK